VDRLVIDGPALGLGTAQWGMPYGIANANGPPPDHEIRAMLEVARDAGIRVIDTARAYGSSEARVGRLASPSADWTVVTKLTAELDESNLANALSQANESLAASRRDLRRETLDVVLVHRGSHRTIHGGAVWAHLQEQRDAAAIGSLGVSAVGPREALDALEDPDVAVIEVATSLFDQRLADLGFFEDVQGEGKTVLIRSPFLQGVGHLRPEVLPPHLVEVIPLLRRVRTWSADRDIPVAATFLGYCRLLGPHTTLVGCEEVNQLVANVAAWQTVVDPAELRDLCTTVGGLPARTVYPSCWPST
jgi:aryl-alcohol dehydrogenase-like predicted oxidoreductase